MPLNAEQPTTVCGLHRLDGAVGSPTADHQPVTKSVDGLMVVTADDVPLLTGRLRSERTGLEEDLVLAALQAPKRSAVRVAAVGVDQVLHEGPAQCHVYDVDASTDAEHGDASLKRTPEQRDLELVPIGVGRFGRGVALRSVHRRLHVGPADQQERVDSLQQLGGSSRIHGQQHRDRPRPLHGRDVRIRDQVRRLIPEAPARALAHARRYRSPAQTVRS